MSKELEYIQRHIDIVKQQIKGCKIKFTVTDVITKHQYDYYENELQTLESIEKSLNRLEAIDNANPSEALKCLERIGNDYFLGSKDCTVKKIYEKEYNTIKQVLIQAEQDKKKAMAWDIAKEKRIDIESFYTSFIERDFNYDFYASFYRSYGRNKLTKEEFNLLKECLG